MKVTFNIPDGILKEAKNTAEKQKTSLTRMIENALREYLRKEKNKKDEYKLNIHTFKGGVFKDSELENNWNRIREISQR